MAGSSKKRRSADTSSASSACEQAKKKREDEERKGQNSNTNAMAVTGTSVQVAASQEEAWAPFYLPSDVKELPVSFDEVCAAAQRTKLHVVHTKCFHDLRLSSMCGCELWVKHENHQRTGSFKERGAANALLQLPEKRRKNGVIAASAGNHALALALHGQSLGVPVTVVMPKFAPLTKIKNCQLYGATVHIHGQHMNDAIEYAMSIAREKDLTYINGYDHPHIIAGQGVIGLEMLEKVPEADAIVVPVGGGGLIAGIALAAKNIKPSIKIIGVETSHCPSMYKAFEEGEPVQVRVDDTIADGLAVSKVGANAYQISKKLVDRIVLVHEKDVALAILRLLEVTKTVVEGAGATGIAALLGGYLPELAGKTVITPLCGGNIDMSVLGRIIERGLVEDSRMVRLKCAISDRPGGLASLVNMISEQGASVKSIAHDRTFTKPTSKSIRFGIANVDVTMVLETRDKDHVERIKAEVRKMDFVTLLATHEAADEEDEQLAEKKYEEERKLASSKPSSTPDMDGDEAGDEE